jgi:hypothetical protein
LNVSFTVSPAESVNFSSSPVTDQATITVAPSPIPITWSPFSTLVYGGTLNEKYLNASSTVPGVTFAYNPQPPDVLAVGNAILSVTATTTSINYSQATTTRTINVVKAPRTVTITSKASATVGSSFTLTAIYSGATTTLSYTSSDTSIVSISNQQATVLAKGKVTITVEASETTNYFHDSATQTFTAIAATA